MILTVEVLICTMYEYVCLNTWIDTRKDAVTEIGVMMCMLPSYAVSYSPSVHIAVG